MKDGLQRVKDHISCHVSDECWLEADWGIQEWAVVFAHGSLWKQECNELQAYNGVYTSGK